MFSVDQDTLVLIQDLLDQAARCCLKTIMRRELSHETRTRLAKFLYGLMNQRLTIIHRVEVRGPAEFGKVLQFLGRANEALDKADAELARQSSE